MNIDKIFKTIWRLLYPYLIFLGVTVVTQIILLMPDCIRLIQDSGISDPNQLYDALMQIVYDKAMFYTFVGDLVAIPILYLFFYWDKQKCRKMNMIVNYVPLPLYLYGFAALFGIAGCLSLNNLIDLSGIVNLSPIYQKMAETVFGGEIGIVFLASVIAAPLLEELLFRGLMYKRLRFVCNPMVAAIISSVAFGITHGNLVQFSYAFLAGLLLAYVYEKYKNLWAPILFHVCANAVSVVLGDLQLDNSMIWLKLLLFVVETVALFGIYRLIKCRVNRQTELIVGESQKGQLE